MRCYGNQVNQLQKGVRQTLGKEDEGRDGVVDNRVTVS